MDLLLENINDKVKSLKLKSKLLGIKINIDLLNEIYGNKVIFKYNDDNKIFISKIKCNIVSLELPALEELDLQNLFRYGAFYADEIDFENPFKPTKYKLTTLKVPEELNIDFENIRWLDSIERIWVYNYSNINSIHEYSSGKMVVILSKTGGKAKIIKT